MYNKFRIQFKINNNQLKWKKTLGSYFLSLLKISLFNSLQSIDIYFLLNQEILCFLWKLKQYFIMECGQFKEILVLMGIREKMYCFKFCINDNVIVVDLLDNLIKLVSTATKQRNNQRDTLLLNQYHSVLMLISFSSSDDKEVSKFGM